MTAGDLMRTHRTVQNITQGDMAERLGISVAVYSDYEHGRKKIEEPHLTQIADIFDMHRKTEAIFRKLAGEAEPDEKYETLFQDSLKMFRMSRGNVENN